MNDGAEVVFEQHRAYLKGLAYRMVGSLSEIDDLLQEAELKWCQVDAVVDNPKAYLSKLLTRLCLDHLKSARVRREQYVGPWLPEPVLDEASVRPDASHELAQDISFALMLALERLSPLERAAFLLHDVFDVDYRDVAETLLKSEDACRQLAARARAHLRDDKPRHKPTPEETRRVLMAFAAAASGDMKPLEGVLAADAVFYSDGGGRVAAATRPVLGRDRIVRFVAGVLSKSYKCSTIQSRPAQINGLPGVVLSVNGKVLQTLAFDIRDGALDAIYAVRNPDKLGHVH